MRTAHAAAGVNNHHVSFNVNFGSALNMRSGGTGAGGGEIGGGLGGPIGGLGGALGGGLAGGGRSINLNGSSVRYFRSRSQSIYIPKRPDYVNLAFPWKPAMIFSTIMLVAGLLDIVLGILAIMTKAHLYKIGYGFWIGLYFVGYGIQGMFTSLRRKYRYIGTYTALSIAAIILAGANFCIGLWAVGEDNRGQYISPSEARERMELENYHVNTTDWQYVQQWKDTYKWKLAVDSCVLTIGGLMYVVALLSAVAGCKGVLYEETAPPVSGKVGDESHTRKLAFGWHSVKRPF